MADFSPGLKSTLGNYFSDDQIQKMQDAGISETQLMSLGLTSAPQTTTSNYYSGSQGNPQMSLSAGGIGQTNNANLLGTMMQLGAARNQPQQQAPPQNAADPRLGANLLGAQALQRIGLNPSNTMVVNPTPGQTPGNSQFAQSGVSPVSQPMVMDISGQPMPQTSVPSIFSPAVRAGTATQAPAATATQIPTSVSVPEWQQWYGQNVGKTIYVNGQPQTINQSVSPDQLLNAFQKNQVSWGAPQQQPSMQMPAPTTMQITPTAQPTAAQPGPAQPFAAPPSIPTANVPPAPNIQMPPSAPGLAASAQQPEPYTGTVHTDPSMSQAVSKLMGLSFNPWHPGAGGPAAGAMAMPRKMATGGYVSGADDPDPDPLVTSAGNEQPGTSAAADRTITNLAIALSGGNPHDPMTQKAGLAQTAMSQAAQSGKPMQDYAANANWRAIPSAIPPPAPGNYPTTALNAPRKTGQDETQPINPLYAAMLTGATR